MLRSLLFVSVSVVVMGCVGVAVATPYSDSLQDTPVPETLSEKRPSGVASAVYLTSGFPRDAARMMAATVPHKLPTLTRPSTAPDQRDTGFSGMGGHNFAALLSDPVRNGQLDGAFASVTASILTPSIVQDGVLPMNLLGLREIVRLMSSATAKLQILDFKMAKFNLGSQTGNPISRSGQNIHSSDRQLQIVPRGMAHIGAASRLFKTVQLFVAENLLTLLPVGMIGMIFVFLLFRRIEKTV